MSAPVDPAPVLEPPPPAGKRWLTPVLLVLAANVIGMGWLAVRQGSSDSTRLLIDASIQVLCGALLVFFAYRVLTRFPFRTTELMTMVVLLSLGELVTLETLKTFRQASLVLEGRDKEALLGPTLQACLFVAAVLLVGGALGLRYCEKLKLDGTLSRMWAVASGMLALPAVTGFFGFVVLAVSEIAGPDGPTDLLGIYLLLWFASCTLLLSNIVYWVRSSAVQSDVSWRNAEMKQGGSQDPPRIFR